MSAPAYAELAVDKSNGTAIFTDLLSVGVTVKGKSSKLLVIATWSAEQNIYNAFVRMQLDGATILGAGMGQDVVVADTHTTGAMVKLVSATKGAHTVKLQFHGNGINVLSVNPNTQPLTDHCHLFVLEVPSGGPALLLATDKVPTFVQLGGSLTTTNAYAGLVSGVVNVSQAARVLVLLTASGVHNAAKGTTFFQMLVDGVVQSGAAIAQNTGYPFGFAMVWCPLLAAGNHTISIEWKHDAGSTTINPGEANQTSHARLFLQEQPTV